MRWRTAGRVRIFGLDRSSSPGRGDSSDADLNAGGVEEHRRDRHRSGRNRAAQASRRSARQTSISQDRRNVFSFGRTRKIGAGHVHQVRPEGRGPSAATRRRRVRRRPYRHGDDHHLLQRGSAQEQGSESAEIASSNAASGFGRRRSRRGRRAASHSQGALAVPWPDQGTAVHGWGPASARHSFSIWPTKALQSEVSAAPRTLKGRNPAPSDNGPTGTAGDRRADARRGRPMLASVEEAAGRLTVFAPRSTRKLLCVQMFAPVLSEQVKAWFWAISLG